jgi:hypothetical protein
VSDPPGATANGVVVIDCVDRVRPLTTLYAHPLNRLSDTGPWTVNVTFSEAVHSFEPQSTVTNAVVVPGSFRNVSSQSFEYAVYWNSTVNDPRLDIRVDIPAGAAKDRADNLNFAAPEFLQLGMNTVCVTWC